MPLSKVRAFKPWEIASAKVLSQTYAWRVKGTAKCPSWENGRETRNR